MKKSLLFVTLGLAISFPVYYFLALNGSLTTKIVLCLVFGIPFFLALKPIAKKFKEKSYYGQVLILTGILSLILSFFSYQASEFLYSRSNQDPKELLEKSNTHTMGVIIEKNHYDAVRIKGKITAERWEVVYEFNDKNNIPHKGTYSSTSPIKYKVKDILKVKYVEEKPEINMIVKD